MPLLKYLAEYSTQRPFVGVVHLMFECGIRRFLPKGTNFHELGHGEINRIEKLLNHRPRKCLNYRTPYEVFREARGALDV